MFATSTGTSIDTWYTRPGQVGTRVWYGMHVAWYGMVCTWRGMVWYNMAMGLMGMVPVPGILGCIIKFEGHLKRS